jgi:hypothetical protein
MPHTIARGPVCKRAPRKDTMRATSCGFVPVSVSSFPCLASLVAGRQDLQARRATGTRVSGVGLRTPLAARMTGLRELNGGGSQRPARGTNTKPTLCQPATWSVGKRWGSDGVIVSRRPIFVRLRTALTHDTGGYPASNRRRAPGRGVTTCPNADGIRLSRPDMALASLK